MVDVEIATDEDGTHYVTGIATRFGVPTSSSGTPKHPWLEGAEYEPVSPRDVQRLPLSTRIRPEPRHEARRNAISKRRQNPALDAYGLLEACEG